MGNPNNLLAQLPPNPFAIYGFTDGSLDNTSTTGAANFSGSISSVSDINSESSAAYLSTSILVGLTNVTNTTVYDIMLRRNLY